MGEVVPFPSWMAQTEPRFRAFADDVTGEVIPMPDKQAERMRFQEREKRLAERKPQ